MINYRVDKIVEAFESKYRSWVNTKDDLDKAQCMEIWRGIYTFYCCDILSNEEYHFLCDRLGYMINDLK